MRDLLEIAEELAEAISKDGRYTQLREAEKAVEGDAESKGLLETFNQKTMAILEKERSLTPVEPEEKRALIELREKIAANPLLQTLNKCQADYSAMMDQINRTLFKKLEVRPQ
ncbi:MAG: YlbF/YmcA family competence regulator [Planctomycetota bacterium]